MKVDPVRSLILTSFARGALAWVVGLVLPNNHVTLEQAFMMMLEKQRPNEHQTGGEVGGTSSPR